MNHFSSKLSYALLGALLLCIVSIPVLAQDEAVATIGDQTITQADLNEAIAPQLQAMEQQMEQQKADMLEQALPFLVESRLIEMEAEARNLSPAELVEAEVTSKVTEVTAEELDAWFEENKARIGNRPRVQIEGQVKQFLAEQRVTPYRESFLTGLRKKYPVTILLEPARAEMGDDSNSPFKGAEDAPVVISEFSDFQCPYCSRIVPNLNQVEKKYGEKVKVVFRQFPLRSIHPEAQKAAEASLCAADQGKFWEMHDAMFAGQKELSVAQLKEKAGILELDTEAFNSCLDSGDKAAAVQADVSAGTAAGVSGTPSIWVNGRQVKFLKGQSQTDAISALVDDELSRMN